MSHHYPAFISFLVCFILRSVKSKTALSKAFLLLLLLFSPGLLLGQISYKNFEEAQQVIGQADFRTLNFTPNAVHTPAATSVALSGAGTLAVASHTPGRVLIWHIRPQGNGQAADVVIGKPDFTTTSYTEASATSMQDCAGVAFSPDGKKLLVSDALNNRVLIWNSIPTTNGQAADVVIGQKNFTETNAGNAANKLFYPAGVFVSPAGQLLINDVLNNRVLVYNTIPATNGATADVIIGQPASGSNLAGSAANQMHRPWYSTVAPDGRLLVSDTNNHRVLIFDAIPTTNGASARLVIGQPGFSSNPASGLASNKLNAPLGLAVSRKGQLAVADFSNNRVMLYDSIPASNGAAANVVLGQPDFSTNTPHHSGISARSMATPTGVQFDFNGRLFVSERKGQGPSQSGRVLVFGNPVGKQADLGIRTTANMALVCRDINLNYQVSILNNGPNLATKVAITLFIPAALKQAATSPSSSAGTYSPQNNTWTLPTLNPGQTATLTFTGTVPPEFSGQIIRQSAVIKSADQVDPNLNNHASGTELTVPGSLPAAPVVKPVTICTGSDTTLTATGAGTIRWYDAAQNGTLLFTGPSFDTGPLHATTTYYVEAYNGCIASERTPVTVTVNQPIGNNIISGNQTVCWGQPLAVLTGQTPTGGNGNYQYLWQISTDNEIWRDVFADNRSQQKDLNPGGLATTAYFRRLVIAGPCAHSYSNVITVQVNPLPAVSLSGFPDKLCADTPPFTLTGTPAGGTFSGPGMSGNTFNPAAAGVGVHFISYSFINENQCRNTVTRMVIVGAALFAGNNQAVCISNAPFALTGAIPTGGTWSGPGVNASGAFDPAAAGVGSHVLTYTLTGNFGCGNDPQTISATRTIHVTALPVVLAGASQNVCIDLPDFTLSGFSPATGTWSGPGVQANGTFSPKAAGLGTHTLTYTFSNGVCVEKATKTITVSPAPTVTLAAFNRHCSSTYVPVLLTGGFPQGGTYSGPGVSKNRFSPSQAGVGTHTITYTYTDPNGCTTSASQPITVEICTGVAEQQILKTLEVYPNPAQDQLQVMFRLPAPGPLTVRLLNTAGQVVLRQDRARQTGLYTHTFNVGALARSVYVLQIITDKAIVSKRIILN